VLPESQRERIDVVLVSPRNPLNIGAAARAMANFGFRRLSVVAPFAPMWRLARSAVGAPDLLLGAVESVTLADAVADCTLVVGTGTLTYRKPEQPVVSLPDLAPLVARELSQGGRVAVVFGSEKHGLTRDDLSWCHLFVEIPTDPRQPSMNLGQAVAVCLYELAVRAVPAPESPFVEPATLIPLTTSAAPSGRLELLAGVIEEAMQAAGYSPRGVQSANRHDLRLLLRRLALSAHDTRRILGLFRRILWRMKRMGVVACLAALALALTAQEQPPAAPASITARQTAAAPQAERMMADMPDFWKLYYQAVAEKADYRPKDPSILRQNTADRKARLLTSFGQDESAVAAIRKAKFEPAIKDGKPVAVLLDLDVPFRIFSKRTNVHAPPEAADKPAEPQLPGPFSLPRP
jgi:TrmH family RNA methyltransferase